MGRSGKPLRPPPMPPKLHREARKLPPRRAIFIACEGKTEEAYFLWYPREHRTTGANVKVVGQLGDPRSVVEHALARKKELAAQGERDKDSFSFSFETWAVVDVDEHKRLPEARTLAAANDIGLVISNPCFEIWALLHLADQTAWIHRHDCQRRLHEEMPSYHHENCPILDTDLLRGKEPDARLRVKGLDRRHDTAETPGENPLTSVGKLCDALRARG